MMKAASATVDAATARKMKSNRKDAEMTDTKWGPWIKHTSTGRPAGLKDEHKMQVLFIEGKSGTLSSISTRCVCGHVWDEDTLAYRLEIKTETYVVYGEIGEVGDSFTRDRLHSDTHKITYVIEDGKVVSCVMEKL